MDELLTFGLLAFCGAIVVWTIVRFVNKPPKMWRWMCAAVIAFGIAHCIRLLMEMWP